MISKEAIRRGYNRGNYTIGTHTRPAWVTDITRSGGVKGVQVDPAVISEVTSDRLRVIADEVLTSEADVISWTRNWQADPTIAETQGAPATSKGVIVRVSTVERTQGVMHPASEPVIPVMVSVGWSNATGVALSLCGGTVPGVCELNKPINFDPQSQTIEVEAGMFGNVFEQTIQEEYGMTMGHWSSSFSISTVGGWAVCRGAGQPSTRYGKTEDMVFGMDVVLADGRLITVGGYACSAIGPGLQQMFIGLEGTLGVIVHVRLKLHRLSDYGRAIARGFSSFASGLEICREILQYGANPVALRLYDSLESGVQFGLPETNVLLITNEEQSDMVDAVLTISEHVCKQSGEGPDGEAILERWLGTRYLTGRSVEGPKKSPGLVADTLEMMGRRRDPSAVYDDVVAAINAVPGMLAGSAHQFHAYVDGACLYLSLRGDVVIEQRGTWYRVVWDAANVMLIKHNASLSHYHGVGLLRSPYMQALLGESFSISTDIKKVLDPQNILNPGKLGLSVGLRSYRVGQL